MLTSTELARVKAQLGQLECNEREAEIYLQSLSLGASSIQDLARSLKMNRITVHSAAEQLIEKGLLFESRKGKKRLIAATEPEAFRAILQRKRNALRVAEQNLDYTIGLLAKLRPESASKPSIKFYEGLDGFKKMIEETLETAGEILIWQNVGRLTEFVETDYLEDCVRRRSEKGIASRLIFPPGSFAERLQGKAEKYKAKIRLLPVDPLWSAGIFLWDSKVALLSLTAGKHTCTILENQDLAYFFRKIVFGTAWEKAKPIA